MALYLLFFLVRLPIVSQVVGRHIVYVSPHFYIVAAMGLYVLGTCISMLFSSYWAVRLFGIAAFFSFVAAYAFYATWFISVWCFFAAVLSAIVLVQFQWRSASRSKQPSLSVPAG